MTHGDARRPAQPARVRAATQVHLRVDPVRCDGIGLCAHLAPSLIELDRWGYPIVAGEGLARREVGQARAAARACPRRALWLEERPT